MCIATNLRLRADAAAAVRAEAQRSGRSQQDVIREAIDRQLGLTAGNGPRSEYDVLLASGTVRPPRHPYQVPSRRITLPAGSTTLDLIDRDERLLR